MPGGHEDAAAVTSLGKPLCAAEIIRKGIRPSLYASFDLDPASLLSDGDARQHAASWPGTVLAVPQVRVCARWISCLRVASIGCR